MGFSDKRMGFTIIELLVSIIVIGLLLALLVPAVQAAREAARKTQCNNNLKQISLAIRSFETSHRHFPGNGWGFLWIGEPDRGVGERQPGGWVYQILPFLEKKNLAEIGRDQNSATREQSLGDLMEQPMQVLQCPSRSGQMLSPVRPGQAPVNAEFRENAVKTHYAINEGDWISDTGPGPGSFRAGDDGVFEWKNLKAVTGVSFQRSRVRVQSISDGISNTYLVGEKYVSQKGYGTHDDPGYDQSCMSGVDVDLNRWTIRPPLQDGDEIGLATARRFGSPHSSGCHMSFCDGSVRFISYSIDGETHRRLGNRKDGNPVSLP